MSLQRTQQETTSREFVLWIEYLKQKMNSPDRSDYYEMQTALEVRRKFAKSPEKMKLSDMKIPFDLEDKRPQPGRRKFYTTREANAILAQRKAGLIAATEGKRK